MSLFTEMSKSEEEMDLGGNLELSFGHAKVEMPMKHPSEDDK